MDEALQFYKEQEIDIAFLEAFSENERAIQLYKKTRYQVTDERIF